VIILPINEYEVILIRDLILLKGALNILTSEANSKKYLFKSSPQL
jgi:hypothetical protein